MADCAGEGVIFGTKTKIPLKDSELVVDLLVIRDIWLQRTAADGKRGLELAFKAPGR